MMEDDDGIELSLGLSCGSSASKSKVKDNNSDVKMEEGGVSKLMGGSLNVADVSFKHFLPHHVGKQDSNCLQRNEQGIQPRENFWTDLGKCSSQEAETASNDVNDKPLQFNRYQDLWSANNKPNEVSEEKLDKQEISANLWLEPGRKRKMSFEEMNHQKKHEKEVEHADGHDSNPASRTQQIAGFDVRSLRDGVSNGNHSNDDLKLNQGALPTLLRATEESGASSSSQKEDDSKGNNIIFKPKEIPDRRTIVEGIPHEVSAIRPGIGPDVKFGGCGSCPDLPWVSTTGPGPNGKTISGVAYRYGQNQTRIVCACHGNHMSSEEFVQHASDAPAQENNAGLASFAGGNPTASAAQS